MCSVAKTGWVHLRGALQVGRIVRAALKDDASTVANLLVGVGCSSGCAELCRRSGKLALPALRRGERVRRIWPVGVVPSGAAEVAVAAGDSNSDRRATMVLAHVARGDCSHVVAALALCLRAAHRVVVVQNLLLARSFRFGGAETGLCQPVAVT
jgi:hypothetical protein